jgi:hypothetical protein
MFDKALNNVMSPNQNVTPRQFGENNGMISSGEDDEKDEFEDDDEDEIIGEDDRRLLEDVKLTAEDIVIVASFKLPIQVQKDSATGKWQVLPSRSMLYPTLFKLREKKKMVKIVCIGWPGIIPQSEQESEEITEVLKPYGCVPVFLDSDTIEHFFYFHETVLRPLFHNFKGLNDIEYDLDSSEFW